jgi:hypothetical protein
MDMTPRTPQSMTVIKMLIGMTIPQTQEGETKTQNNNDNDYNKKPNFIHNINNIPLFTCTQFGQARQTPRQAAHPCPVVRERQGKKKKSD